MKLKNFILISAIIFIIGCSNGVIQSCTNTTIYINQTVTVPAVCEPCHACAPSKEIQTVTVPDTKCQERQGEIIRNYADCLINLSHYTSLDSNACYAALDKCNNTLIDYTNRLNNISTYARGYK
jgi:hypothetical protein